MHVRELIGGIYDPDPSVAGAELESHHSNTNVNRPTGSLKAVLCAQCAIAEVKSCYACPSMLSASSRHTPRILCS